MLEINKNYLLYQNQKPIAVQIPIAEFERSSDRETDQKYHLLCIMYGFERAIAQALTCQFAITILFRHNNRNNLIFILTVNPKITI